MLVRRYFCLVIRNLTSQQEQNFSPIGEIINTHTHTHAHNTHLHISNKHTSKEIIKKVGHG